MGTELEEGRCASCGILLGKKANGARKKRCCSKKCQYLYMSKIISTKLSGRTVSDETRKKISIISKSRWLNSEYRKLRTDSNIRMWSRPGFKENQSKMRIGISPTDVTKKKMRVSAINHIKNNRGSLRANVGKNETKILDYIESICGEKLIRQYVIGELGYIVDGFDESNNVVYEIYESYHKKTIDKDLIRQKEIQDYLGCGFYIIYDY